MKTERWQRIEDLYHLVLEQEPAERSVFLTAACEADEELRCEVESLLASHEQAGEFINEPVIEAAARLLAEHETRSIIGRQIGPYRIIELLGAGGMGEVYRAEDARLNRQVAIKLLPLLFTNEEERVRRFEREARAASALNHPNILTIYEIGQVNETRFIATELIDGVTLREILAEARMGIGEVLDISIQTASALVAAHGAGIIHRDIKPGNIMRRQDGYVKILDFGLAKLTERPSPSLARKAIDSTEPGSVMGTAHYMSPEQARGLEVDARTDIWSLGCVLYEMIAGRAPFEGVTNSDVIASILEREPAPLALLPTEEVPAELQRIVRKALRKDREERYQTSKDMLLDLKSLRREIDTAKEKQLVQIVGRAGLNVKATEAVAPVSPHNHVVRTPIAQSNFSQRKKGVRQGVWLLMWGILITPLIALLSLEFEFSLTWVLVNAIIGFLGGLLRIGYALIFEEGAPLFFLQEPQAKLNKASHTAALPPQRTVPIGYWRGETVEKAQPSASIKGGIDPP